MSKRTQHILAKEAKITDAFLSELKAGWKNASSLIADRLALLTGPDIRVWLKGGDLSQRQEGLARFMAGQEADTDAASPNPTLTNNIGLTCETDQAF